jgi:hypothetical protein
MDLHPCPACARHIRAFESVCPFCSAAMPEGFGSVPKAKIAAPRSRAAILFMGATAVSACGGSTLTTAGTDAGSADATEDTMAVAAYGPAIIDSGIQDAGEDMTAVAAYGPAIIDSGAKDATEDQDSGFLVLYGPAPVDSGEG